MRSNLRKYPFFCIIDDGGFDYVLAKEKKGKINMDTYYNILKLAKDFDIKIPICFTMKYLDKENISGLGTPLDYLDELIGFLKQNSRYIEIGYHGLTHEDNGHIGEFYHLEENKPVPERIQKEHLEKSQKIFDYWGLRFPELFVPPYHAWGEGVTDKILSEYGVKYLVSEKKFRFSGYKYQWSESPYLEFLPRSSLGLSGSDYNLNSQTTRKIRFFPKKTLFDFAKCHIIPQNLLIRLRIHKSLFNQPVHSYMTHIGNFAGKALDFWYRIFDFVINNKYLHLCKSNKEAVILYKKLN